MKKSTNHNLFVAMLRSEGVPLPEAEVRFHETRRWRWDFAWNHGSQRLALEIQGGIFAGGRHSRGAGMVKDMEKFSEAACLGWRIIYCQPKELCTAKTMDLIKRALNA